jgi:hypothetical protein
LIVPNVVEVQTSTQESSGLSSEKHQVSVVVVVEPAISEEKSKEEDEKK